MKYLIITLALFTLAVTTIAETQIATLRKGVPISVESDNPAKIGVIHDQPTQKRAYPMQPPIIPHKVEHYQLDLFANTCLSCHSRRRVEESQAPVVSVTHYMDREGNFLADVSPRRYFCLQCHVTQNDSKPLLGNDFTDVDEIIRSKKQEH